MGRWASNGQTLEHDSVILGDSNAAIDVIIDIVDYHFNRYFRHIYNNAQTTSFSKGTSQ